MLETRYMIRLLKREDLDHAFKIIQDCIIDLNQQEIHQWDESYPNISHISDDITSGKTYGIFESLKLVGIVIVDDQQDKEYESIKWSYNKTPIAVIKRLAIHPYFQGKGYSKKLMIFAEEFIQNQGFKSIRLDAYSINQRALQFYDSLNYQRNGKVFFPNRDSPFICFEKEIQDSLP